MNAQDIVNVLLFELKEYGAIFWHKSRYNSYYIKFKDCRLGSIRISDHNERSKYNYKYKLLTDSNNIDSDILKIITSIKFNAKMLNNFDKNKYIVYDNAIKEYVEIKEKDYKEYILTKNKKDKLK